MVWWIWLMGKCPRVQEMSYCMRISVMNLLAKAEELVADRDLPAEKKLKSLTMWLLLQ